MACEYDCEPNNEQVDQQNGNNENDPIQVPNEIMDASQSVLQDASDNEEDDITRALNFPPLIIADETFNCDNTQQQDDHRSVMRSVSLSPPPVGGAGTPDRQLDMDTDTHHSSELPQVAEGAQADGARADRCKEVDL